MEYIDKLALLKQNEIFSDYVTKNGNAMNDMYTQIIDLANKNDKNFIAFADAINCLTRRINELEEKHNGTMA